MGTAAPTDHVERLEALGGLADQLGAALYEAMEFLVARDEMDAKLRLQQPYPSPLAVLCGNAVEAWREWKFPPVP